MHRVKESGDKSKKIVCLSPYGADAIHEVLGVLGIDLAGVEMLVVQDLPSPFTVSTLADLHDVAFRNEVRGTFSEQPINFSAIPSKRRPMACLERLLRWHQRVCAVTWCQNDPFKTGKFTALENFLGILSEVPHRRAEKESALPYQGPGREELERIYENILHLVRGFLPQNLFEVSTLLK